MALRDSRESMWAALEQLDGETERDHQLLDQARAAAAKHLNHQVDLALGFRGLTPVMELLDEIGFQG